MGYYIETPNSKNKAQFLIENHRAINLLTEHNLRNCIEGPTISTHIPVIVVDNGPFEAAAIVFDKDELDAFTDEYDLRPKYYLMVPREEVLKLNPFVEDRLNW